jgi:hypothetical protein
LSSLLPCNFNFFPSIQNIVGILKNFGIFTLYQVSSRLVTLLKFIYVSTQFPGIFVITVYFKLILFSKLMIFCSWNFCYFPDLHCSVISTHSTWFYSHCSLVCFLCANNFEIHQTMVYSVVTVIS